MAGLRGRGSLLSAQCLGYRKVAASSGRAPVAEAKVSRVDKAFVLTDEALSTNSLQLNWRIALLYLCKQHQGRAGGLYEIIRRLFSPERSPAMNTLATGGLSTNLDATFSVPPSDAKSVE
jgi:hypothetical protein